MKTLALRALKWIVAVGSILGGLYLSGFGGATAIYNLFKTERAEAEIMMEKKIDEREAKIMAVHRSDMDGLHGKIDLLSKQNSTIINQNYKMIEMMKKDQP